MQFKSVKGYSGGAQLGILFLFLLGGFILAAIAQFAITIKMLPPGASLTDPEDLKNAILDPVNVGYARIMQVMSTFMLLFIPAIMYSWVVNGKKTFWLGFSKYFTWKQAGIAFLITFAAGIAISPLADFSKWVVGHFPNLDAMARELEMLYEEQAKALSNLKSWPEFFTAIIIMAFFPALFEEVFFRGAMQNLFVRWWKKPMIAILVTSIIFSLIHSSIYLFLSRAVLGFVLGLIYYKTKNIWLNIIAHFLNNFIVLVNLFWMYKSGQKIDIAKADPTFEWWIALPAMVVMILLFILLRKMSAKNRQFILDKEAMLLSAENTYDPFIKKDIA